MAFDRQKIFNTAYLGLAGQGFMQSQDEYGDCLYRGLYGLRCAIGHCISDEAYTPDIEDLAARDPDVLNVLGAPLNETDFLCDLQAAHDENADGLPMKNALEAFAAQRNLTIPATPTGGQATPASHPTGD